MRHTELTRRLGPLLTVAVTLAACGGTTARHAAAPHVAGAAPSPPGVGTPPPRDYRRYYPPGTHRASRAVVRVITAWSNELRAGHVRRAASYFSIPVVVENASPTIRLGSRREVLAFNSTLPCGAHIVRALASARYTVATFVLTERPGSPGCGATGKLAATAFRMRHGKISEWRRVLVPPPLGPPENVDQGVPLT